MTIYEFADIIGRELELIRYANQGERWICQFKNCMVKDNKNDAVMKGDYGNAKTPLGAIQSYTANIRGKHLVFDDMSDRRMEYNVPQLIKSPLTN